MPKKTGALLLLCLLFAGLLAACGDATATTAPASSPAASTTRASTAGTTTTAAASSATTAAATSGTSTTAAAGGAATTSAATTSATGATTTSAASTTTTAAGTTTVAGATTAAGATTSASGTGSSTGTGTVPAPPNSSPITLQEADAQTLLTSLNLPGDLAKNSKLTLYVSDDDLDTISPAYATKLTGANFKPAIPGLNEVLTKQGTSYSGVVSDGTTDAIIAATTITGDITNGTGGTLPPDLLKTINDQAKGKKTGIFVISGKGLVQALFAAAAASGGTGATGSGTPTTGAGTSTTPGATPTK